MFVEYIPVECGGLGTQRFFLRFYAGQPTVDVTPVEGPSAPSREVEIRERWVFAASPTRSHPLDVGKMRSLVVNAPSLAKFFTRDVFFARGEAGTLSCCTRERERIRSRIESEYEREREEREVRSERTVRERERDDENDERFVR